MALVGRDDIQVHQDNNDHDGNDNTVNTGNDQDQDAARMAAATGAAGGTGTTNFNLRVEQNKIPEFFGTKSKDMISAADFIRQLEDLAKTNRWTDAQTYYHFVNALRNPACKWLSSVVDWDDDECDQPVWSKFKDVFKQEYTVQTNKRLILEGLANLAMKPSETTNELLTRITCTTRVIKKSFAEYGSVVTCMNINSFKTAFGKKHKKQENCKKRKCSLMVQITDEFTENILGIDFAKILITL
jgi:hypothetical protein